MTPTRGEQFEDGRDHKALVEAIAARRAPAIFETF
jgi:hypothetical protein